MVSSISDNEKTAKEQSCSLDDVNNLAGDRDYVEGGKSREYLHVNDLVGYYDTVGTAGKKDDYCHAFVTKIFSPNDEDFDKDVPIILHNSMVVYQHTKVKRLGHFDGNQVVDIPNNEGGTWF